MEVAKQTPALCIRFIYGSFHML